MTPWPSLALARRRKEALRTYRAVRLGGFALMAAAVVVLGMVESGRLDPASAVTDAAAVAGLGAAFAWASLHWLVKVEAPRNRAEWRAVRRIVAGIGLKFLAVPLVVLGGGWLAWDVQPLDASLALAGLGIAAYAYGLVARMEGIAMLPERRDGGWP